LIAATADSMEANADENDREGRIHLARPTQHLHPVHARHLEVGQQQVGSLRVDQRERTKRVGRGQALVSRSLQDASAVLNYVRLVVQDRQNAFHTRSYATHSQGFHPAVLAQSD
jgi:hypothetical protein